MIRILLFLIFLSQQAICQQKHFFNEKDLLGDWIGIKTKENQYPIEGISFEADNVFEHKLGFFKTINNTKKFLGTKGKYKLNEGYLYLLTPGTKKWEKYKLLILHAKHLKISAENNVFDFSRPVKSATSLLKFDKIIVSTSGSFDPVPVSNTVIDANGSVIFQGIDETSKKGLLAGTITRESYSNLQADFSKSNLNRLTSWYKGNATDQQTVSITFIKQGKIYRTIADYGRAAPYQFKSAYIQVMYLYQKLSLKPLHNPPYLENVDLRFRLGDQVLDIRQSELFFLKEALRSGKIVQKNFVKRFRFHSYTPNTNNNIDLYTDGRYFQFLNKGKLIVIDIGFNFYDFNSDKWRWRKDSKIQPMYH